MPVFEFIILYLFMDSVSDSCGENDPSVQFYDSYDRRRESKATTDDEKRESYSEGILNELRRRTSENTKRRRSSVGEQSCKKCLVF